MAKRTTAPKRSSSKKKVAKKAKSLVNYGNKSLYYSSRNTPLKTSQKAVFRYSEFISMNPGASGIAASNIFSANGLFDPNITGVGHQPRGFDQLMSLYDHYVVTNCKVELFVTQNSSNQTSNVFCVFTDTATSVFSNYNELFEYPTSKVLQLGQTTGGECPGYLTMNIEPPKFLGRKSPMSDPELKGNASSNPAEGAFIQIFAGPGDESSDTGNVYVRVLITYEAQLIEPKLPNQS